MMLPSGGDDVQQLCEAGEEEFLEIMALVGMASKPLHVRRLQKALQEWVSSPGQCFPSLYMVPYINTPHAAERRNTRFQAMRYSDLQRLGADIMKFLLLFWPMHTRFSASKIKRVLASFFVPLGKNPLDALVLTGYITGSSVM